MGSERRLGVTGHQAREGLDWDWTREQVARVLREDGPVSEALTSLAVGTDQLFAQEALRLNAPVTAVLPFAGYERCFEAEGLANYRRLLDRCAQTVILERTGSDEEAFLAAGLHIADTCDLLVAVWDGKPSEGLGGTADVVAHAVASGRQIVHLDPFARTIRRLPS